MRATEELQVLIPGFLDRQGLLSLDRCLRYVEAA